jgi:predicted ATP-dependent serine protease
LPKPPLPTAPDPQALCQPRPEKQEVPLRQFTGLDPRRMQQLLAVMDRDTPLKSYTANIFVNIVGGFQVGRGGGEGGGGRGARLGTFWQ